MGRSASFNIDHFQTSELRDVFQGSRKGLDLLSAKANAFEDPALFARAVQEWPGDNRRAFLVRAMLELSNKLDERAETGFSPMAKPESMPLVGAGQQPYIDYSLGIVSKIDALDSGAGDYHGCFGFAGYDYFGSDNLISRIEIPTSDPAAKDPILRIRLSSEYRRQKNKDMRFVPPPEKKILDDAFSRLKGVVTFAFKHLKEHVFPSQKRRVYERLHQLIANYEYARTHSRSVAEFNTIWSVRTFRILGYEVMFVELEDLFEHEATAVNVAGTLGHIIRENGLFVEIINEIIGKAGDCDLLFSPKKDGYLPIFMTDEKSGIRFPLRCAKEGSDYFLLSAGGEGFKMNIGSASDDEVREFLFLHRGRWSPNIFAPLYLYRCGLNGFISGTSSIKYAVVMGHVMERLFHERHPPNLLCICSVSPEEFLHRAVYAGRGELPKSIMRYEPSLLCKMIFSTQDDVREEIAKLRKHSAKGKPA